MSRAWKFLAAGAVGPFSRVAWPTPAPAGPGDWVRAREPGALCMGAVHACRIADLPWWLNDELSEVELEGDVTPARRKVMAERGRLVRRVEAWGPAAAEAFARD